MTLLEVKNVKKIYTMRFGGNQVEALEDISFSVEKGEYVAIMGESGSGKTTLLNLLASLDKPTKGEILLDGESLHAIKNKELCAFRRDNLGFVFQDFNLLDTLSLQDNILLPLVLQGKKFDEMNERLLPLARQLGISELLQKYPYEVSGGQKQRTAAARALITEPKLILADEPTGALDSKAATGLLHLFAEVNKLGQTILMVTHSIQAAKCAGRILFIKDGNLFHQIYRGNSTDDEMYRKIADTLTVIQAGGEVL
ncbi:ABC transporter ATP-binding protein [Clostridium aminobutyricum]|uniref:ABC transporter ATP-binding protein n=1 Tax=Clostridium aminobutyricum TaxID=33953 RepID=A0A939IGL7_CLOAM|nr:ABC transporter ATP-binding protein [Clostridium aminobutyricum]MBN7772122.1 ABC transporter ATP-binding protein [Clostridium aminobutyricum]